MLVRNTLHMLVGMIPKHDWGKGIQASEIMQQNNCDCTFDASRVIHPEVVMPRGTVVTIQYYLGVTQHIYSHVCPFSTHLFQTNSWVLLHENAPAPAHYPWNSSYNQNRSVCSPTRFAWFSPCRLFYYWILSVYIKEGIT